MNAPMPVLDGREVVRLTLPTVLAVASSWPRPAEPRGPVVLAVQRPRAGIDAERLGRAR